MNGSVLTEGHLSMLQAQIEQLKDQMIDPREFGQLEQEVKQLSAQMTAMQTTLVEINKTLSEAKGGWRALMLLGGAGAAAGSLITWGLQHIRFFP